MSNTDDPKPLDHDEVVPEEFEDEDLYDGEDDDGLGPPDEDEDQPGLPTTAPAERTVNRLHEKVETVR